MTAPAGQPARDFCTALAAVGGTLSQYYYCDRKAGHQGQHKAIAPNGAVVKKWGESGV